MEISRGGPGYFKAFILGNFAHFKGIFQGGFAHFGGIINGLNWPIYRGNSKLKADLARGIAAPVGIPPPCQGHQEEDGAHKR